MFGARLEDLLTNADLSFMTRHFASELPQRLLDHGKVSEAVEILVLNHGMSSLEARERLEYAASRAGITVVRAADIVSGSTRSASRGLRATAAPPPPLRCGAPPHRPHRQVRDITTDIFTSVGSTPQQRRLTSRRTPCWPGRAARAADGQHPWRGSRTWTRTRNCSINS